MTASKHDLVDLQKRLNADPQLKKKFLDDPVDTLQNEGITLTPEMQRAVGHMVDRLKRPGAMVPGAGIAPQDLKAITITIGVDF